MIKSLLLAAVLMGGNVEQMEAGYTADVQPVNTLAADSWWRPNKNKI